MTSETRQRAMRAIGFKLWWDSPNRSETRCEMIPKLKLRHRLLCWLLFRIEAKHGLGVGFDEIDLDAMKWMLAGNHMLYSHVCRLMRDCFYVRMAREYDKERRND